MLKSTTLITNPTNFKKIKITNEYSLYGSNYLENPDNDDWLCLNFVNSKGFLFLGFKSNGDQKELSVENFCFPLLNGSQGLAFTKEFKDYLGIIIKKNDENIYIPVTRDEAKRPILSIQIPTEFLIPKDCHLSIFINNEAVFALHYPNKPYILNINDLGYCNLLIKDKINNKWYLEKFKGVSSDFKGFKNWIAGDVSSLNVDYKNINGQLQEIGIDRPSLGNEKRYPLLSYMGVPADIRFNLLHEYHPGILFLFNAQSRKYIEWETYQGDSEILLVDKNVVYYRVFDELFRANIEDNKLVDITLLVKDIHVPEIHWAFISQ